LRALGRVEEARVAHERAVEKLTAAYGADHDRVATASANLARDLLALGRPAAARPLLERAEMTLARTADTVQLARVRFDLARTRWESGADRAIARQLATRARQRVVAEGGHPKHLLAEIDAWLASNSSG